MHSKCTFNLYYQQCQHLQRRHRRKLNAPLQVYVSRRPSQAGLPVHVRVAHPAGSPAPTLLHAPLQTRRVDQRPKVYRCWDATYRPQGQYRSVGTWTPHPETGHSTATPQNVYFILKRQQRKGGGLPSVLTTSVWMPRARDFSSGLMHLNQSHSYQNRDTDRLVNS